MITLGQEEGNRGKKHAKRSRPYPQPSRRHGKKCALKMDDRGFPPRLDIFKAMAKNLAGQNAGQMGDSKLAKLGEAWLQKFLWTVNVHW